jgi:GGDEF domain-containing protein
MNRDRSHVSSFWSDDPLIIADAERRETLFDAETGAPGTILLLDRAECALARCLRTRLHVAALVVVIDDDADSRSRPRAPWPTLVQRLRAALRPDDTVARVAVDTLVVICADVADEQAAETIKERLFVSIETACRIGVALGTGTEAGAALIRQGYDRATI